MDNEISEPELQEEFHAIMEPIKTEDTKITWRLAKPEVITESELCESFSLCKGDVLLKSKQESPLQANPEVQKKYNSKSEKMLPLCRLCASQRRDMVCLFSWNERYGNIIEKIEYCLPIMVKIDDLLPNKACQLCLKQLEFCYEFSKAVEEAERQLTQFNVETQNDHVKKEKYCQTSTPSKAQVARKRTSNKGKFKLSSHQKRDGRQTAPISKELETTGKVETSGGCNNKHENVDLCRISVPQNETVNGNSISNDFSLSTVCLEKGLPESTAKILNSEVGDRPTTRSRKPKDSNTRSNRMRQCKRKVKYLEEILSEDEFIVKKQRTKNSSRCSINEPCNSWSALRADKASQVPEKDSSKRSSLFEKFSCSYCEKTFTYKPHLVGHIRTHTGELPYSCPFCPKKHATRQGRSIHLRIHTGERRHECTICQRKFSWTGALQLHMITHSENRPCDCFLCDKTFKRKFQRNIHVASVHSEKKNYHCNICRGEFKYYATLQRHMKNQHKLQNPYEKSVQV